MILTIYKGSKINYRKRKRRLRPGVKWIAAVLAAAVVLIVVICILSYTPVTSNAVSSKASSSTPVSSSSETVSSSSSPSSSSAASSSAVSKPSSSSTPEASEAAFKYFDDAVFTGDSVTVDFVNFPEMDNTTVIGSIGISAYRALTDHNAEINADKSVKGWLPERIAAAKPKKVYMMFGINDLCWGKQMTESYFIQNYTKLVDEIKSRCPGAKIYVQSILPVTAASENKKSYPFDNAKIDQFNAALDKLCTQKGLRYLDVASVIKGPDGKLPANVSDDGIHLKYKEYTKWFNYLIANE